MPPETDSRVTVAVITHNRRAELARTLDRLEDLPERPAVIVVDNGSADGTAAYVRWNYPAVTLITAAPTSGPSAAISPCAGSPPPTSHSATTTPGGTPVR